MAQLLSAISFCSFLVDVLSFFHYYFLLMTLHLCIKSTTKIVVVVALQLALYVLHFSRKCNELTPVQHFLKMKYPSIAICK